MQIRRVNPTELGVFPRLTQVVRVTGGTTLYISGQPGHGGDHYGQTKEALGKVKAALSSQHAGFENLVKLTYFLVRITPETFQGFARALGEVLGDEKDWPAATVVGVESLAYEDMLVEIDAVAVIP